MKIIFPVYTRGEKKKEDRSKEKKKSFLVILYHVFTSQNSVCEWTCTKVVGLYECYTAILCYPFLNMGTNWLGVYNIEEQKISFSFRIKADHMMKILFYFLLFSSVNGV